MNNEIKEIIEKAMREAFEAGHWEGYQNGVHDQKLDDEVGKYSPSYIYIRNSDWTDYLKTLNTPKPL